MADLVILPGELNLEIYRGDDTTFQVTITDEGDPVVLPTSGWLAQVRETAGQSTDDALAEFTVDASSAASGVVSLTLADADTIELPAVCRWDLQLTESGVVRTYLAGKVKVREQVTQ